MESPRFKVWDKKDESWVVYIAALVGPETIFEGQADSTLKTLVIKPSMRDKYEIVWEDENGEFIPPMNECCETYLKLKKIGDSTLPGMYYTYKDYEYCPRCGTKLEDD